MRATGPISRALLDAAREPGTLAELAQRAYQACGAAQPVKRHTVADLVRADKLVVVGETRVANRNRPAYVYQSAETLASDGTSSTGSERPHTPQDPVYYDIQLMLQSWPG